jgi:hypothetical protein
VAVVVVVVEAHLDQTILLEQLVAQVEVLVAQDFYLQAELAGKVETQRMTIEMAILFQTLVLLEM